MNRIIRWINRLADEQWLETKEIDWEVKRARYVKPGSYEYESEDYAALVLDPLGSKQGTTYLLRKQVDLPSSWLGDPVGLWLESGGEGLLRINGVPYHGLDRNHCYVPLQQEHTGLHPLMEIELYDPIPEPVDPLNAQSTVHPPIAYIRSKLVRVNKPLQSLLFSVKAVYEAALLQGERELKRLRLMDLLTRTLEEACRLLDEGSSAPAEWPGLLEKKLISDAKAISPVTGKQGTIHMVGQSHIDVAWLWPVRETVRKVSRTFSTINTLMNEYPDFTYSQSQPLLYAFAKEHYTPSSFRNRNNIRS